MQNELDKLKEQFRKRKKEAGLDSERANTLRATRTESTESEQDSVALQD